MNFGRMETKTSAPGINDAGSVREPTFERMITGNNSTNRALTDQHDSGRREKSLRSATNPAPENQYQIHHSQHPADLCLLTTRTLDPHSHTLRSSDPLPHTSAHQSAHSQVDSKHPQVSCAHKGSKEHHTSLQMQTCSQHQSTIFTTTNSSGGSDYGHLLSQLVQCQPSTFSHHKYVFSPHSTHEP